MVDHQTTVSTDQQEPQVQNILTEKARSEREIGEIPNNWNRPHHARVVDDPFGKDCGGFCGGLWFGRTGTFSSFCCKKMIGWILC